MQHKHTAPLPLEIGPTDVKSLLDSQADILLIDCREHDERAICHIEASVFIPMNEMPSRLSEIESHRDRNIVVLCHAGIRSLNVTRWLRNQGFSKTQSMSGGIDAWSVEVDDTVPRY